MYVQSRTKGCNSCSDANFETVRVSYMRKYSDSRAYWHRRRNNCCEPCGPRLYASNTLFIRFVFNLFVSHLIMSVIILLFDEKKKYIYDSNYNFNYIIRRKVLLSINRLLIYILFDMPPSKPANPKTVQSFVPNRKILLYERFKIYRFSI